LLPICKKHDKAVTFHRFFACGTQNCNMNLLLCNMNKSK
jgi:hypothetical protein